ncbi:hypothetical protein SK128_021079 [Halocaridina rubra]|uniref:Uncharacterized protein n=1 Tax=Halocaridina rubra TaxID=373956 RepID=A0AAN8X4N0_HALRR
MKLLLGLKWIVAAFLLLEMTEAIFKKWKRVSLPPGECVLGFDYCKIGCSYCTTCYVNFIECSMKPRQGPPRMNLTDSCIIALDKCKAGCSDCTPCYTTFIDCKAQNNRSGTSTVTPHGGPGTTGSAYPDPSNKEQKVNLTFSGSGNVIASSGSSFGGQSEDNGIDIGIPGIPVFIVEQEIMPEGMLQSPLTSADPGDETEPISLDNAADHPNIGLSAIRFPQDTEATEVKYEGGDSNKQQDTELFDRAAYLDVSDPSLVVSPNPMNDWSYHKAESPELAQNDPDHHESSQNPVDDSVQGSTSKANDGEYLDLNDGIRLAYKANDNIEPPLVR